MRRLALCVFLVIAAGSGRLAAQDTPPAAAPSAGSANAAPVSATSPKAASPAATVPRTDGTAHTPTEIMLPHDLSPWSMFLAADIFVKAVMIGLAFASLMTWTIFFAKSIEFAVASRRLKQGLSRVDGVGSFMEAKLAVGKKDRVLSTFLGAALTETNLSDGGSGIKERVESRISELARAESQTMRRGMPLLATIGSTAPFVGLFGTVWGIMNAFIGISKSQTTNLAVVAPGIAEALLATAIGLVAAIPAVVIYNHFAQSGRRYQALVSQASGAVQRLLSRELGKRPAGVAIRAAE